MHVEQHTSLVNHENRHGKVPAALSPIHKCTDYTRVPGGTYYGRWMSHGWRCAKERKNKNDFSTFLSIRKVGIVTKEKDT